MSPFSFPDANAARPGYPIYAADVTLTAGEPTVLPPFRLTPPPSPERYTPINNATADQIVTETQRKCQEPFLIYACRQPSSSGGMWGQGGQPELILASWTPG